MSKGGTGNNNTRSTTPKWDRGKEPFIPFDQNVVMWMETHDIEHLLKSPPKADDEKELRHQKQVRVVIIGQLAREDKTTAHCFPYLCGARQYLLAKYQPSAKADIETLWNGWEALRKGNRSVKDYHSEIIHIYKRLVALKSPLEDHSVRRKMFAVVKEFDMLRYEIEDKTELTFRDHG